MAHPQPQQQHFMLLYCVVFLYAVCFMSQVCAWVGVRGVVVLFAAQVAVSRGARAHMCV
jgi:hypothetical protein